jgi:predicted ribosomally synthesized peptide with nif11-like leader
MALKDAKITEELAKKLEAAETIEEALAILKEDGIDATEEEIKELLPEKGDELTDNNLEGVAGGLLLPTFPIPGSQIIKWWFLRNKLPKWMRKLLGW